MHLAVQKRGENLLYAQDVLTFYEIFITVLIDHY